MDFIHKVNSVQKKYFVDNQDRLLNKQKLYGKQNCDKSNTR